MHEFSIAMSIIEVAEKEALAVEAVSISSLILDIGTMSGIEYYALDTALEMAVKDTMLEKSIITVNKIQASAKCSDCDHTFIIESITDACPECGSFFSDVISGNELKIKSITVEDNTK